MIVLSETGLLAFSVKIEPFVACGSSEEAPNIQGRHGGESVLKKLHQLDGLIKWSQRDEWVEVFGWIFESHVGQVLDSFDLDPDELADILGEQHMNNLWGCVFEDSLTRPRPPDDELTMVDDYLKRRGWKETASNRRYIRAIGDSHFGLYQVEAVVSGESMVLRDLIFGGPAVQVKEYTATKLLTQADWIGARIIDLSDVKEIGGGLLNFDPARDRGQVEQIAAEWQQLEREIRARSDPDPVGANDMTRLEFARLAMQYSLGPSLSQMWLDNFLSARMDRPPPPSKNSDGDELLFHTMFYAFGPGVGRSRVEAKLALMPNLRLEDDGVWNWIETDSTEVDQEPMQQLITRDGDRLMVALEDGTTVLGTVELSEEGVVVAVSSRRRADMAKVMIKASLGSLLSRPTTEIETMDEIAAAMDAEADDELEP